MQDTLNSIKVMLHERLTNPLLANFVIAWFIWNWKFLSILFLSEQPFNYRIKQIDALSNPLCPYIQIDYFLYPLGYALLATFLWPFITGLYYKFYYEQQTKLSNKKKDASGKKLLTVEKSQDMIARYSKMEIDFKKQLANKDESMIALAAENDDFINNRTNDAELSNDLVEAREDNEQLREKIKELKEEGLKSKNNEELTSIAKEKIKKLPSETEASKNILEDFKQDLDFLSGNEKHYLKTLITSEDNKLTISNKVDFTPINSLIKSKFIYLSNQTNNSTTLNLDKAIINYIDDMTAKEEEALGIL